MSLNSRKLCFQPTEPSDDDQKDIQIYYIQTLGDTWIDYYYILLKYMESVHPVSHSARILHELDIKVLQKKVMYKIKNATHATFDSIINTVEIYNGPLTFDSFGCTVVNSVRMWYNKDFMKDIKVDKLGIYPWYLTIFHKPEIYGKDKSDKWFINNTINKRS